MLVAVCWRHSQYNRGRVGMLLPLLMLAPIKNRSPTSQSCHAFRRQCPSRISMQPILVSSRTFNREFKKFDVGSLLSCHRNTRKCHEHQYCLQSIVTVDSACLESRLLMVNLSIKSKDYRQINARFVFVELCFILVRIQYLTNACT